MEGEPRDIDGEAGDIASWLYCTSPRWGLRFFSEYQKGPDASRKHSRMASGPRGQIFL